MVILPRSATIFPKLVTVPPPSTSTINPAGSLLEAKYIFLPAAKIVCPSGVLITPLFSIFSENNTTLPLVAVVMFAPFSTTRLPVEIAPTASNTDLKVPSELINPSLNNLSVMSNVPAYKEPTLN